MDYRELGVSDSDLLSVTETAELLGVSTAQIQSMVKRGILRPDPTSPSTLKKRLFRRVDVATLHEVRSKGYSYARAIVEARTSALETRALRRELDQVKSLLGLDIPSLGLGRDELISVLLKAEDAIRDIPTKDPRELLEWAKVLHGLSEAHYEAITRYTDQEQPWRVFLVLGRKLCAAQDPLETRRNIELQNIYMLLHAALQRARRCAFFYIQELYGKMHAAKLFPDVESDPHENVILMSFNSLSWESP